jgi:SAM-dependent methyltransferase
MHPDAYTSLAANEERGWYYQARGRCVRRLIERHVSHDSPLDILDVGSGTGGTSQSLCRFGRVTCLEPSAQALRLAARYPELKLVCGATNQIGALLPAASFDLVTIMGVLYHRDVADPADALAQVNGALRPGGWLIWNEGVHPILARAHDEFVESGRRFGPREMRALVESRGFRVRGAAHLAAWGFPIALALSLTQRLKRRLFAARDYAGHVSDDRPLPALLNAALREITYREWWCAQHVAALPFGVSYLLIAEKVSEVECSRSMSRRVA